MFVGPNKRKIKFDFYFEARITTNENTQTMSVFDRVQNSEMSS